MKRSNSLENLTDQNSKKKIPANVATSSHQNPVNADFNKNEDAAGDLVQNEPTAGPSHVANAEEIPTFTDIDDFDYTDKIQESLLSIAQFVRHIREYKKVSKETKKKTLKLQTKNVETLLRLFIGGITDKLPQISLLDKQQRDYLSEYLTDPLLDRSNLNMDVVEGLGLNNEFLENYPKINIPDMQTVTSVDALYKLDPDDYKSLKLVDGPEVFIPLLTFKENAIEPLTLNPIFINNVHVGYENPYKTEIMAFKTKKFCDPPKDQVMPPPVDVSKVTMVCNDDQLKALIEHLETVPVFAVDLEHHSYKSYLGLTCLMQITTGTGGDFVVDVLEVWNSMYLLNRVFTKQDIVKVFHGGKNDIQCLQRDFNIYVVGMFDTLEAAKILQLHTSSLEHLISRYCKIKPEEIQNVFFWWDRPLPEYVLKSAITETHYLVYIYGQMGKELLNKAYGETSMYAEVFNKCKFTAIIPYNKPFPVAVNFNTEVLTCFTEEQKEHWNSILTWRYDLARKVEENPAYILDKDNFKSLIKQMSVEVEYMLRTFNQMSSRHPLFEEKNLENFLNCLLIDPVTYYAELEAANKKREVDPKTDVTNADKSGEAIKSDEVAQPSETLERMALLQIDTTDSTS